LCCWACFDVASVKNDEHQLEAEAEDKPVENEENGEPEEEVRNVCPLIYENNNFLKEYG